jgi:hypothetical protein
MESKIYTQAQELEKFFEIQLRKLLPKYSKTSNNTNRVNLPCMSLQDLIEDMDDPKNNDYSPSNNPKRKRSTPSI